jgi:rfaE bifunctional protein nucleotidyltransferase chain/domain
VRYPVVYGQGTQLDLESLLSDLERRRRDGARIVTANGCFDLLHAGHVQHLEETRSLGDLLVVALNNDRSVRSVKGPGRPIVPERERAAVLAAMRAVHAVVVFDQPTPNEVLSRIRPDLHCKGGDHANTVLPEAEAVRAAGGEIRILPRYLDNSTTRLAAEATRLTLEAQLAQASPAAEPVGLVETLLTEASVVTRATARDLSSTIAEAAALVAERLASGGKLLFCGNGGSAAHAQHAAAEFVGRFSTDAALPAIALSADAATITAISNDYGFEHVFARQIEALGAPGDVLIPLSVSGSSPNLLIAADRASALGLSVIGVTGRRGNELASRCDISIALPAEDSPIVQPLQLLVLHAITAIAEAKLTSAEEEPPRAGRPARRDI